MAKHRRSNALMRAPASVIVMPRRRGALRRAASHASHVVRRHAPQAAKRALPTVGVAVGAAVLGYAKEKGYLDKLPQLAGSSVVTLGLAGYLATRFVKNHYVREAGLAALAVAAFDFARVQAGGVSGIDDGGQGG